MKYLGALFLSLVLLTACSDSEEAVKPKKEEKQEKQEKEKTDKQEQQEKKDNEEVQEKEETPVTPVQAEKKEEPKKVSAEEARGILKNNLDSIFKTFDDAGKKHGWNASKKADFSLLRDQLLPYATVSFTDSELKKAAGDYYCECDNIIEPMISYNVRFAFTQTKENEINITAIEPANQIYNMASKWEFTLIKKNNTWKLNRWNEISLKGQDLQLTGEEAVLLTADESTKVEFVKEMESPKYGGKIYVLQATTTVEGKEHVSEIAISAKDTRIVYEQAKGTASE
ncbi:hypothetical protein ACFQPF_05305 [Fictibacillus iocasae]|uniref:Lipoprotein n=1 Tax=Fictibacillus iocasae TaxID=2715437 RepID=A0ABW2NQV4_9BACL